MIVLVRLGPADRMIVLVRLGNLFLSRKWEVGINLNLVMYSSLGSRVFHYFRLPPDGSGSDLRLCLEMYNRTGTIAPLAKPTQFRSIKYPMVHQIR
jgi:hypothetical protein